MMPLSDWEIVRQTPMQAGATGNRPSDWEFVRPTPMQAGARASGKALAVVTP